MGEWQKALGKRTDAKPSMSDNESQRETETDSTFGVLPQQTPKLTFLP